MKKAFIFTTDTIIAVTTALVFLTIAYSVPAQNFNWNKSNLYVFAQDSLSVLAKNGNLANDMSSSANASTQLFLNNLPPNLCGRITFYNLTLPVSTLNTMNTTKKNCQEPNEVIVARRTFVVFNEGTYTIVVNYHQAKMELWYV